MLNEINFLCRELSSDCLYPFTTEKDHDKIVDQLSKLPQHGEVVLGVSGLSILNIASVREGIRDVYVLDVANSVAHFWEKILPVLAECEDPEEASLKIQEELISSRELYFEQMQLVSPYNLWDLEARVSKAAELAIARFQAERDSGVSFLSDPSRYARIHYLAKEGRLHFHRLDLTNSWNVNKLISVFKENRVVFDTIYLSNIQYSITDLRALETFSRFKKNLYSLIPSFVPHYVEVTQQGRQALRVGRGAS